MKNTKSSLHEDLSNILSNHGLASESWTGDVLNEVLCQCYDGEERGIFKTHTEFRHHMADVAMGVFERYVKTEWAVLMLNNELHGYEVYPDKLTALRGSLLTGDPVVSRMKSEWTKVGEDDD